jgi:hypothetical protein
MKHKERFVGVLDAVMQEASKIIGCEKVTLYLLEDETKELQETLSAAVRRSVHTLSRTHSKTQQEGVAQVISKGGCTINVRGALGGWGSQGTRGCSLCPVNLRYPLPEGPAAAFRWQCSGVQGNALGWCTRLR